jgi:hypothetical protein
MKIRFTTEQIIAPLQEDVAGATRSDLMLQYSNSHPTFYHGKK